MTAAQFHAVCRFRMPPNTNLDVVVILHAQRIESHNNITVLEFRALLAIFDFPDSGLVTEVC